MILKLRHGNCAYFGDRLAVRFYPATASLTKCQNRVWERPISHTSSHWTEVQKLFVVCQRERRGRGGKPTQNEEFEGRALHFGGFWHPAVSRGSRGGKPPPNEEFQGQTLHIGGFLFPVVSRRGRRRGQGGKPPPTMKSLRVNLFIFWVWFPVVSRRGRGGNPPKVKSLRVKLCVFWGLGSGSVPQRPESQTPSQNGGFEGQALHFWGGLVSGSVPQRPGRQTFPN